MLSRKNGDFRAVVSLTQSELPELSSHSDRLHPKEKVRYRTYQYDRRKIRYLLGRSSAKNAPIEMTDQISLQSIWIDSGVFEFPLVRCPLIENLQVSIGHCESIGLGPVLQGQHPMGIDIEKVGDQHKRVMKDQLTAKERNLLQYVDLDHLKGHASLWSVKEALSKVLKTGMILDFSLLELKTLVYNGGCTTSTFVHFGQYKTISCFLDRYVMLMALPKNSQSNVYQVNGFFSDQRSASSKTLDDKCPNSIWQRSHCSSNLHEQAQTNLRTRTPLRLDRRWHSLKRTKSTKTNFVIL